MFPVYCNFLLSISLLHTIVAKFVSLPHVELNTDLGTTYHLKSIHEGPDFFDVFRWETYNDTAHGYVNYLDKESAIHNNLSYAVEKKFYMRADSKQTVTSGRGRDSVRISSLATFDEGVIILDLEHMPAGCGTWPAFRSKSGSYPMGGLIDIIEGVNRVESNLASLHTLPNCDMPQDREQTGSSVSTICDASVNGNQGCGTQFGSPESFGKALNDNHGGWYVMEKSSKVGIKIWFWPRYSTDIPLEIRHNTHFVHPTKFWGIPNAAFPLDSCNYADHFGSQVLMFDMTFCGGWAGSDWAKSSCAREYGPSCTAFVDNQPSAFIETYWEINSLRVYIP